MHRELSDTDELFEGTHATGLYAFTAVLTTLLAMDLLPALFAWLNGSGWDLPTWDRTLWGYRYALMAAAAGATRALVGGVESLLAGRPGADLAVAIAALAAIAIGEPVVAAEVVVIGLIGECLEAAVFARTRAAVGRLTELFPRRCWRLTDGAEERVFTTQLVVGDTVVVKPGGRVPADGTVTAGRSSLSVQALTGESLPIDAGPGDAVLAGGVNLMGALTVAVTRVGTETVAGRTMRLTADALRDKGTLERQADRLARWFLPAVVALATLTLLANVLWYAGPLRSAESRLSIRAALRVGAVPALSVLVVACPCALVLATPAALAAALGRLAGTGVLLRRASALERLATVRAFAFDKTGTLTEGRFEVAGVAPADGVTEAELLREAARGERLSEHPLAAAVLLAASARSLDVPAVDASAFRAVPGAGVVVDGDEPLRVGSRRLLTEANVAVPDSVERAALALEADGQTTLFVALGGRVLGALGLRDTLRPEAAGVVGELRGMGVSTLEMLTGDRGAPAQAVARRLPEGVAVRAGLTPADKAARVRELSPEGVAMVGDGVNDAPALATATVGLAVGGTDLAARAGDVLLLGEPLRALPFLVRLSREVVRTIRRNVLWFGFGVNAVGILVTAWLWPLLGEGPAWFESGPVAAAVYHQIGSLLVLVFSARLLWFERESAPAAGDWRERFRACDRWLDRVRPGEWLHEATHRPRLALGVLSFVLVFAWLLSGFTAVQPGEVGLVRRFGRVTEELQPGLAWRAPWPVGGVERVDLALARTLEVGFRAPTDTADGLTWASPHAEGDRRPEEAVLLTGDGNLVEALATVRYRVSDARAFRLSAADPESAIRWSAESALRRVAARHPLAELLTSARPSAEREAGDLLASECSRLGLGVAVDGLMLHDLHPPREVVPAYHEVARAIQRRDRAVNDAEAERLRAVGRAAESAALTRADGDATAAERRADAGAAADAFVARLAPGPAGVVAGLAPNPLAASVSLMAMDEAGRRLRPLVRLRLGVDAAAEALRKRDKVLIDADRVPGRRTLWLFDPERVRAAP